MTGRPVASPCIAFCTLDPASGLCLGCGRTVDEIAAWPTLGDAAKARILAQLPARGTGPAQAAANRPSSQ